MKRFFRRPNERKWQRGFTLVELLVVIAIIGILVAMLLPAIQTARESARRTDCSSKMRQLGLACQMYSQTNSEMIPTGIESQYRHSGITALLPFVEATVLYNNYDWGLDAFDDTPPDPSTTLTSNNAGVVSTRLPIFVCPSDNKTGFYAPTGGSGSYARSNYVQNFGRGFLGTTDNGEYGPFRVDTSSSYATMAIDGTTNTALYSEIIAGAIPGDPAGAWGFGDAGSCAYTHSTLPNGGPGAAATMTVAGAGASPDFSAAEASASSFHPGGVNVAYAATQVTFVTDNIDGSRWAAYGSANGGEPYFAE